MPNIRWLLALITRTHRFLYRVSGGRLGASALGIQFLMLHHVGRRSGQPRATPLLYVPDGRSFVVAASNMGDRREPAWWLNLKARPEARVQIGPRTVEVRARTADACEKERLWPRLEASYRWFADYREQAGREIPVVVLEPSD